MEFSAKIKELMTKSVPEDFTITEEERDTALSRAFVLFSNVQPSGPPTTQVLEPLTWLAVGVLRKYMQDFFKVGDGADVPSQ